ncbi:hypothetical protein DSO57_1022347 [Entomophthora muscae]|uniref:Uncharacterized protein n=1 Tax=Entomophthora muscae TaxID=34485 RepID=A0ACC2U1N0_9FUNG|nr:hypothetical protein DSO57_1022347 [Entomophthora muscae]
MSFKSSHSKEFSECVPLPSNTSVESAGECPFLTSGAHYRGTTHSNQPPSSEPDTPPSIPKDLTGFGERYLDVINVEDLPVLPSCQYTEVPVVSLARLTLINCQNLASVASGLFLGYQLSQEPTNTQLSLFHQHPEVQHLMTIFCSYLATDEGNLKRFPTLNNEACSRYCYKKQYGTSGIDCTTAQGAYSALPLHFGSLAVSAPAIVLSNENYNILIGNLFM